MKQIKLSAFVLRQRKEPRRDLSNVWHRFTERTGRIISQFVAHSKILVLACRGLSDGTGTLSQEALREHQSLFNWQRFGHRGMAAVVVSVMGDLTEWWQWMSSIM